MARDSDSLAASDSAVVNLVLVIDDDPEAAELVKSLLALDGIDALTARDGGQAQSMFVMRKPDFVILDIMLPGESGFEVCERFKKNDPRVPVMLISAIDLEDARDLARRVGADAYLAKPYDPELLVPMVRETATSVWKKNRGDVDGAHEAVRFSCRCGKKFKVSALHRGKALTCPQCGESAVVPRN